MHRAHSIYAGVLFCAAEKRFWGLPTHIPKSAGPELFHPLFSEKDPRALFARGRPPPVNRIGMYSIRKAAFDLVRRWALASAGHTCCRALQSATAAHR